MHLMELYKFYKCLFLLGLLNQFVTTHAARQNVGRRQKMNMRCTRRFTPGICSDAPSPVWTFNFFLQNCTERLGCLKVTRSNRFPSYTSCQRVCRAFIDIYTQSLSDNSEIPKELRSVFETEGRRLDDRATFYEDQINLQEIKADVWGSPALHVDMHDFRNLALEGVFVPDIDYTDDQANEDISDLSHHVSDAGDLELGF